MQQWLSEVNRVEQNKTSSHSLQLPRHATGGTSTLVGVVVLLNLSTKFP